MRLCTRRVARQQTKIAWLSTHQREDQREKTSTKTGATCDKSDIFVNYRVAHRGRLPPSVDLSCRYHVRKRICMTSLQRVRHKSRILPLNLNNNWMTVVISRSRHVTGWQSWFAVSYLPVTTTKWRMLIGSLTLTWREIPLVIGQVSRISLWPVEWGSWFKPQCSAKSKGSNCFLKSQAVTAFRLWTAIRWPWYHV